MRGRIWTESELGRLRELYPSRPTAEIAKVLDVSVYRVYKKANLLGLRKTAECLRAHARLQKGSDVGREFRFKPGLTPANKGLRRPGWYAGRMRETQFRKGSRSGQAAKNWCPIGTIRADGEGFLRIKIRECVHGKEPTGFGNKDAWPLYNRWVWEQVKGPIPPKHIIAFRDGNRGNCAIENLELMSMRDNARRNSMWARMPRELAEAIQLAGALKRKLRRAHGQE
jgi:hypothetical protein